MLVAILLLTILSFFNTFLILLMVAAINQKTTIIGNFANALSKVVMEVVEKIEKSGK